MGVLIMSNQKYSELFKDLVDLMESMDYKQIYMAMEGMNQTWQFSEDPTKPPTVAEMKNVVLQQIILAVGVIENGYQYAQANQHGFYCEIFVPMKLKEVGFKVEWIRKDSTLLSSKP